MNIMLNLKNKLKNFNFYLDVEKFNNITKNNYKFLLKIK